MTDDRPLLELDDVSVSFPLGRSLRDRLAGRPGPVVRAVDGVSLTVRRGEIVALVGESGSGKTTAAHAALRLVEPGAGTIRFEGEDITHLPPRRLRGLRRRAQVVYQDPYESLNPRYRVEQVLREPLVVHRIAADGADRDARIRRALKQVGLDPPEQYLDRYPHELSGGQRQRVAIAAALVSEPHLLLADEPVSMLDVSVREGILQLLSRLRETGLGILMITHDLSTAAHYADRIVVMYLGHVLEEGPTRAVIRAPQHPYTKALLSAVPRTDPRDRRELAVVRGEIPSATRVPSGCPFHPRCPVAGEGCDTVEPALAACAAPLHRAACIYVDDPAAASEVAGAR